MASINTPNDQQLDESDCSICNGLGWVVPNAHLGDPGFGKAIPCRCRESLSDPSRLVQLQRYSNLGPLTKVRFDSIQPSGPSSTDSDKELFERAFNKAKEFAEDPSGWMILLGKSGSGKTQLAAAIVNRALEKGHPSFFMFVPDLLDHLRSTYTSSSDISYDQLFEQVRSAPVLVLDDLGTQSATSWAQEKIYQIINYRYVNTLPTIFTISTPVEELDSHWQTRLLDVSNSLICNLSGDIGDVYRDDWGKIDNRILDRFTFNSFDPKGNSANREQAQSLDMALAYAKNFAISPEGWLVFLGPTGSGKTHLSISIANECISNGRHVMYFLVADLLDYLRDTFSPDSKVTYDRRFDQVRNADILILRDFGAYHATPWAREKLYQLLVHRHDSRLPTIITTRELDEAKRSDPVISRLLDVTLTSVIPIDAPDYRYRGRGS